MTITWPGFLMICLTIVSTALSIGFVVGFYYGALFGIASGRLEATEKRLKARLDGILQEKEKGLTA